MRVKADLSGALLADTIAAIAGKRAETRVHSTWDAVIPSIATMPTYTVRQGDCIGKISYIHGFDWERVWNDPSNRELKAKRGDPNVLLPGDVVFIPEKELKSKDCATDKKHSFTLRNVPAKLRIRLKDDTEDQSKYSSSFSPGDVSHMEDSDFEGAKREFNPLASVPFSLFIDGKHITDGESDGNGFIEISLPPAAQQGRLVLSPHTPAEDVRILQLGGLDPADEISGIKQRMRNLGFPCDTSAEANPAFEAAVMLFQERYGLPITGEPDDATCNKLKQEHGG